jgi:hypothetical protein
MHSLINLRTDTCSVDRTLTANSANNTLSATNIAAANKTLWSVTA